MKIKYTQLAPAYQEYPATGVNALWQPGQSSDVSGARASALIATGLFVDDEIGVQEVAITSRTSAQGVDKFDFARRTGAVVVVHSLGADSIGAAITAAQRLDYAIIPAGSLQIGDVIRVSHARTKSGATDTSNAVLRAGAANAVADGVIASLPGLATTATSAGTIMEFKITSAITMRQLGATNGNTSFSGTSTGAIYADKTIPNIASSDLYIGLFDTMTSGTEYVTLGAFSIEYIPQVI